MVLVEETVLALRNMRMNGYDALLEKVVHFCEQHDIAVPDMSAVYVRTGRPRRNAQMDTNDHMFRVDLFTAALDKLLRELDNRFSAESMAMLRLAACISPRNQFQSFDVPKLVFLARVYYEPDFLDLELALLEQQLLRFIHAIESDNVLRKI